MTNKELIAEQQQILLKKGVLKVQGYATVQINDEPRQIPLPEDIHTFNGWKARGYRVKKGEHAVASFPIWKYTSKEKKPEELTGNPLEDAPKTNMFLKTSAFFSASQVEKIVS